MAINLTTDDARRSLTDHAASKGADIFEAYGPVIGWKQLQQILADGKFVRYPCEIRFDTTNLEAGEFGHADALGERPEEGYVISIHPYYMTQLDKVPWLVFYHLVMVNYGDFASSDDAEAFAAAALGLSVDDYYEGLCELADQLE